MDDVSLSLQLWTHRQQDLVGLTVALAIGLLIGLEREWRFRDQDRADQAGLRTFGLIGLCGGLSQLMAQALGVWVLAAALLSLAGLLLARQPREAGGSDITTDVAALATLLLGAWAVSGQTVAAAGFGVAVAVLLNLKPTLQAWVERLSETEVHATLRLLVISLVILPILPDRGFGPYAALNPYVIWWLVVLISSLSFAGYIAVRVAGTQRGFLLTGLLGGLVSSTAATVSFARVARIQPMHVRILAAAVALACTVMAARVYLLASALAPAIALRLAWPMGLMALTGLAAAGLLWRGSGSVRGMGQDSFSNPFELMPAIRFAGLLAIIFLLSRWLQAEFGATGLYVLALSAGMADVDAITISIAQGGGMELDTGTRVIAIVLAVASNTVIKSLIALRLGGLAMGGWTALVLGLMLAGALLGLILPTPG